MAMAIPMLSQWFLPLAFVIAGLIAGSIFIRTVLPVFRKCCLKAKQESLEVVAAASSRYITPWFVLLGFYIGAPFAPLNQQTIILLKEILFIIATVSVTLFVSKVGVDLFGIYARSQNGFLRTTSMLKNLIYGLVGIFGALVILQSLSLSITPFLAALGIGGIAVALAVQDPLSNFFSGLHIIASTQVRPGDYIRLDTGAEGVVMDISWRTTTLRAPTNYTILIPNSKLASAIVTNYHLEISDMVFSVDAIVGYDSNLEDVERIAMDVAKDVIKNNSGSVHEFEPIFLYTGLGDSGINFSVSFKAGDFGKQAAMRHEFIKRLYRRFEAEGVMCHIRPPAST